MPLNQTLHHHHHHLDPYPTRPKMDRPPDLPSPTGTRKVELQGPRPTPLRVSKDSHKITKQHKPPLHPTKHTHHHHHLYNDSNPSNPIAVNDNRQPVIIYAVSPKIIHADPSNFMSIVQRLTGNTTIVHNNDDEGGNDKDNCSSSSGFVRDEVPVSPAARFAAIERSISPSSSSRRNQNQNNRDLMGLVDDNRWSDHNLNQLSTAGGILSPAPGNLPVISSTMFSPAVDMQAMFGLQDVLSPLMFGHSFLASPTGFSPTLIVSPTFDFSNLFDNRF